MYGILHKFVCRKRNLTGKLCRVYKEVVAWMLEIADSVDVYTII